MMTFMWDKTSKYSKHICFFIVKCQICNADIEKNYMNSLFCIMSTQCFIIIILPYKV